LRVSALYRERDYNGGGDGLELDASASGSRELCRVDCGVVDL